MKFRSSIVHYSTGIGIHRPSTFRERLSAQWSLYRAYRGTSTSERLRRLRRLLREPFLLPAKVR